MLDVWSRPVVGWATANQPRTAFVLDAFEIALAQRRPESVIHHSGRGCQYTSYAFGKRCREAGVVPLMASTGDAYDNAMAESFFATLEREVIDRRRFKSRAEFGIRPPRHLLLEKQTAVARITLTTDC